MYSLVLMTAMRTAPSTAEFNGYFRDLFNRGDCSGCTGCNGCNGAARYSCSGGCSGSCNGCCGGLFSGERIRSLFNPIGCCGGCCGGMAYSSGCCGGSMAYSGGYSCFGGPVVSAPAQGFESYPSLPGFGVPAPNMIPYAPPEAAPSVVPERQSFAPRPAAFNTTMTVASPTPTANRATVIVRLPADAQLFADGTALKMTGGERKFITPELPGGMEYTYRFTAEYERNGEVLSVSKKVTLRPGSTVAVEFTDHSATKPAPTGSDAATSKGDAVAAAPVSLTRVSETPTSTPIPVPAAQPAQPATITVKLPEGATLYVDDRRNASSDSVRRFTTPTLPAGREFGYMLKVEVMRNGMPESVTQKVTFRSGEQVIVDMSGVGAGR